MSSMKSRCIREPLCTSVHLHLLLSLAHPPLLLPLLYIYIYIPSTPIPSCLLASFPPSFPPSLLSPSYLLQRVPIRILNGCFQSINIFSLLQLYQELGPCLLDLRSLVLGRRGGRRQGKGGGGGKEEKGTSKPSGLMGEGVLSSLQGGVALGGWFLLHGGADARLPGQSGDGKEKDDEEEECSCRWSLSFHCYSGCLPS